MLGTKWIKTKTSNKIKILNRRFKNFSREAKKAIIPITTIPSQ
jgi:hypothetical protein